MRNVSVTAAAVAIAGIGASGWSMKWSGTNSVEYPSASAWRAFSRKSAADAACEHMTPKRNLRSCAMRRQVIRRFDQLPVEPKPNVLRSVVPKSSTSSHLGRFAAHHPSLFSSPSEVARSRVRPFLGETSATEPQSHPTLRRARSVVCRNCARASSLQTGRTARERVPHHHVMQTAPREDLDVDDVIVAAEFVAKLDR